MKKPSLSVDKKLKLDLRHYPVRPHIGVGGVILWNNRVVLIKRKYNPGADKWSIPGGHLEVGETLKEGALRESEEETSLDLRIDKLADIIERIDRDDEGKIEYHYILVDYYLKINGDYSEEKPPQPIARDDAKDAKLVPFESLKDYDLTYTVEDLFRKLDIL